MSWPWGVVALSNQVLTPAHCLQAASRQMQGKVLGISRRETRKTPQCILSLYNLVKHLCLGHDDMEMVAIEIYVHMDEANPQGREQRKM